MMLDTRSTLTSYITDLLSVGRVAFTRDEALKALRVSPAAFLKAAARLQHKKQLLNLRHGFYVIVPPQYLSWGAPPTSWYIDDLMRHEGRSYYVGLLKAAELHGATHHAVTEFQVITNKRLPKIRAGRTPIAFYYRKDMSVVLNGVEDQKTDTGRMKVSGVELTALDLLRYPQAIGNVDSAVTALSDLAQKIDAERLALLASGFERTVVQRLGYLLDSIGGRDRAAPLRRHLSQYTHLPWIELEPSLTAHKNLKSRPLERDLRWHVIVRRKPEPDE